MPGTTPPNRKSKSSGLPEDARLAYNRMLPRMQAYRTIIQQMQLKLSPGNLSSIRKNHVLAFRKDLVRLVEYVQSEENKQFTHLFFRSPGGLSTLVEESIILQLNAANDLAEDLERIDTTTPNYAAARRGLYLEFQRCLIACREPLNQAEGQFKI